MQPGGILNGVTVNPTIDTVIRIADERHPLALFQPRLFHVVGVDQENLTAAF